MTTRRIVCLSDTHGHHEKLTARLPPGDILVHTGDFCTSGAEGQFRSFAHWFLRQPHPHKVLVAGNHDICLERDLDLARRRLGEGAVYLFDQEAEVAGLRFYGAPWQPAFFDWAFNLPRGGPELREKWARIPEGLDVLLTHGPPLGLLDWVPGKGMVGCEELRNAVTRARPRLHIFGHIHEGTGVERCDGTFFVNAAICTGNYAPRNPIRVIEVPLDRSQPVREVLP